MRELTYYIGTTLDGFAAGPDDEVDFFDVSDDHLQHMVQHRPEVLPTHVRSAMGIDPPNQCFEVVLQGRRTYQPALDAGITSPYAHLRQYVASTTWVSTDPSVTVVSDPVTLVRDLKQQDGGGIWLAGGGTLAAALREEIDRLVVKVYPVLAGAGRGVLAGTFTPQAFRLTGQETFDSGAVELEYVRTRADA